MMKTPLFCSLLIFGLVSPLTVGSANAQFVPGGGFGRPGGAAGGNLGYPNQPVVSPYINLLRNNNNNGLSNINQNVLNYYGLVRPQISAQLSLQALQNQVTLNEQNLAQAEASGLAGVSGHPAFFLNTGRYFAGRGGRAGMGGIGGGGGAAGGAAAGGAAGGAAAGGASPVKPARGQ
jgi:hypothetical protein